MKRPPVVDVALELQMTLGEALPPSGWRDGLNASLARPFM